MSVSGADRTALPPAADVESDPGDGWDDYDFCIIRGKIDGRATVWEGIIAYRPTGGDQPFEEHLLYRSVDDYVNDMYLADDGSFQEPLRSFERQTYMERGNKRVPTPGRNLQSDMERRTKETYTMPDAELAVMGPEPSWLETVALEIDMQQ